MFNNQQNNSKDALNVNTRGPQFMNKDGFDPSTLLIGFWNDMISIKIHPALEKSKQTESKVFDYEKVVNTALTLEKATILKEQIEKKILPAIENDEDKKVGVPVGGDSLIVVGTGKDMTGKISPYIAIHKSLDAKTRKPEMSIHYEFSRGTAIEDYDAKTGEFTLVKDIHGELNIFLEILKASIAGLSNCQTHSSRYVDKFYRSKLLNDISEIAAKLGISTNSYGNKGGYYNKNKNDVFAKQNNSSNQSLDSEPQLETLNNINDIDGFLS